jgi:hypothetical protein
MDKRTYNFAVGVIFIIVAFLFLTLPFLLNYDALFPFMFAVVSFVLGIAFFFMGASEK